MRGLTFELTGPWRWAGLPAKRSIDSERFAGKTARRGGSGVERRVRPRLLPAERAPGLAWALSAWPGDRRPARLRAHAQAHAAI